jgi:hypothetical protein
VPAGRLGTSRIYDDPVQRLDEADWLERRDVHEARVDRWVAPHLYRRARAISHPVDDFLFAYYSYRPAALRRWHPGIGVELTGGATLTYVGVKGYSVRPGRACVDPDVTVARRRQTASIRQLLVATAARPPHLGCFGMHEWAMVYQASADSVRHPAYPLRLGSRETDVVVESHRVTCTHFDAFRFFTDPARPLNVVQPTRTSQLELEQPGCLHATMDLYRWAYTLAPMVPSELVADCFELAYDVRRLDMQASPYDLSDLGIEPVAIETAEGKAAYRAAQQGFAARGALLRSALVVACDAITGVARSAPTPEGSDAQGAIGTPQSDPWG